MCSNRLVSKQICLKSQNKPLALENAVIQAVMMIWVIKPEF